MKIFAAIALTLPMYGHAASLIPAMIGGQVQQFTTDGKVSGCGVTFYAVEKSDVGRVLVFNGSTVTYGNGVGLVKGRVSEVDAKKIYSPSFNLRDLKPLKTMSVWAKAQSSPSTVPIDSVKESEDKGYIIYAATFESVLPVIRAVVLGESIQIGFRVGESKSEQVMFGAVAISPEEREQLGKCLGELVS